MSAIELDNRSVRPADVGWYDDPFGQHLQRFFDGQDWTNHVTHTGPLPCRGCGHSEQTPTD